MSRGPSFKPSNKDENPIKEFYNELKEGKFIGNPFSCRWLGPDLWLASNDPVNPFQFERHTGEIITPCLLPLSNRFIEFPTDGGSIPDFIRGLPNFSRWNYGGAYLIHDWIWWLHKVHPELCHWSFEESNLIMAEAIKTLIEQGYLHSTFEGDAGTVHKIYGGVQSVFAKNKWEFHNAG